MIEVVIDKVHYPVASEWCEIGIGTAVALGELLNGESEEVRAYFSPLFEASKAAGALPESRRRELYEAERRMLALLTGAARRGEGRGFVFGTADDASAERPAAPAGGEQGLGCRDGASVGLEEGDESDGVLSGGGSRSGERQEMMPAAGEVPEAGAWAEALSDERIDALFKRWLWHIPVSLLHEPMYEPVGMEWFCWRGERLRLPRTGRDLAGVRMPLESASAEEFCAASDLLSTSGWRLAPVFAAMLCRPDGEAFSEQAVKRRAATFAELPVSVVFELMFLLLAAHFYMRREFPACYAGRGPLRADAAGGGEEDRVVLSWSQMPLLLCGCRPDRAREVGRTGCYDFMAALHLYMQLR